MLGFSIECIGFGYGKRRRIAVQDRVSDQNHKTSQIGRAARSCNIESLEARQLLSGTAATTTFTDAFTPAPSAQWNDYAGNWTASNGAYYAQTANNNPLTATDLPFNVDNFSLTVTANNLTDGGIWIHSDGTNSNGILLVLGGGGYGQGIRSAPAGTSLYWHTVTDGTVSTQTNEVDGVFTTGDNYTITVTGTGDTYSAYVDGSTTPATTFTTSAFPSGQVGLYDDQPNVAAGGSGSPLTFSDFSLTYAGAPSSLTPTIKGKLPSSVIAGQPASIRQTLTLTNTTGAIFSGGVTTQWFLDTGSNLDANAIPLTTAASKTLKLKNKAHASVSLALKSLPATVPAGTYYLIAEETDAGGSSVAASATAFTVAAGLDSAGLPIPATKSIRINPGKSVRLRISITKAQLAALTPGESYYLTVTETDAQDRVVSVVSPTPFSI